VSVVHSLFILKISLMIHPSAALNPSQQAPRLPVVDHYCGTVERINKALALQTQLSTELGRNVMDVTLDCEDGAPVGGEHAHAVMVRDIAIKHFKDTGVKAAVRIHPVDHPAFEDDIATLAPAFGALAHVMIPKVESVADVERAARLIPTPLPLHGLIESAFAVSQVNAIAAHPRVASLSFGLMDFVSSHNGAIPAQAMTLDAANGQFSHPLVVQAKLALASACHAHGKVPSHCVVTEFKDAAAFESAAWTASSKLGYTRMWSIHPSQIKPILAAFAPNAQDVSIACEMIPAAQAANWAPISFNNTLQDRASYRYYWQVLQSAFATGVQLPNSIQTNYFSKEKI
jgi:citrate lyase subunit beta / citryl-CoA lyase